jgi:hypothetical protein
LRWHVFYSEGFAVNLAVECKNINIENPVVISGIKRTPRESFHHFVESRKGGKFMSDKFSAYYDVTSMGVVRRTVEPSNIYSPNCFVGKSIVRIERSETGKPPNVIVRYTSSKDQEIYDRWSQALASATDLVLEARHYAAKYDVPHTFTVVLPVLVVPNRALWSAEYDENGRLTGAPAEVEQCELFVSREIDVPQEFAELPPSIFIFSHIHFFTIDGFANFLLSLGRDVEWRNACFPEDLVYSARQERLS